MLDDQCRRPKDTPGASPAKDMYPTMIAPLRPRFPFRQCRQLLWYRGILASLCCALLLCFGATPLLAKSLYDNQPPMTDKELVAFMEILPHFRAWAASSKEEAHPSVDKKSGKADFLYSPKAAEWVKVRGWDPARFFTVMGRAAAALAMVEEGNDISSNRPPDMPHVTEAELNLVRRHLAGLLKAGNDAPPINR